MTERILTSGDLVEVTGVDCRVLGGWCYTGVITPIGGGEGTGNFRQFSERQALGIRVALALRNTLRGCTNEGVRAVVAAFELVDDHWLLKHFKARETHFVMTQSDGTPLLREAAMDRVDVQWHYHDLKARLAQVEQRLATLPRNGRWRGLAENNTISG